ncbi:unnamed protein product [Dovyalis caffra]|uniref:Cytochrome c-552/DMSO reductase-like haem-binding domain-containing protein n=1 Tax=Dovyalis caffra TaxID=77055 RepID=A0AAV1SBT9_9ROSI|nr:unnamed protein product [Dovyalis caffra]
MLLRLLLLRLLLGSCWIGWVNSHKESGEWSCESDAEIRVEAEFKPGLITLDGHADDWKDIDAFEFSLLPATDPDADKEYTGGKMAVKALHDGNNVFFLLQVDGNYAYTKGDNHKCPSVALMFPIGDEATYHSMGGCKEGTNTCNRKNCKGHEVDIMHFSIGNAIPGRLYGGNPLDNADGNGGDRFGHLVDLYAWNPHCRYLDGLGPSGKKGKWEEALNKVIRRCTIKGMILAPRITGKGHGGTVASMFTQDAQFTIGGSSKMSVAFWYPVDGNSWHGSGHYSVNCDWIPLDISPGNSMLKASTPGSSGDVASAFALLFSTRFSFEILAAMAGDGSKKSKVSTAPPRKINVQKFAETRASELESLHSIVSNRVNNNFRSQRNKRRRTTAYDNQAAKKRHRKRRKLGLFGKASDDLALASEKEPKKVPRRVRRRIELKKNPEIGFATSGDGTKRLRTHVWHAKRFTMSKLWGFHLPLGLHGSGRGSRALLKWYRDRAVVHDGSYYTAIQLEGPEASITFLSS